MAFLSNTLRRLKLQPLSSLRRFESSIIPPPVNITNIFRAKIANHAEGDLETILLNSQIVREIPVVEETAGVFRVNETDDVQVLVNNFTAPALALALRDRESTLQRAAVLAKNGDFEKLQKLLGPFLMENVAKRRFRNHELDLTNPLTKKQLLLIQRYMHRLPRQLYQPAHSRASVLIPLCNYHGVPSILFEKRSEKVKYKHQICFPGGMLDEESDVTITQTSLRETEEELGLPLDKIEVLGVLRCHWNEVAQVTGIAVTPVVGYIGELKDISLKPNSDEVEQYFTIPIESILDEKKWVQKEQATPIYTDGPHVIWGLTGYILNHFMQNVVMKCRYNDIR
jgi:nudix motif 8